MSARGAGHIHRQFEGAFNDGDDGVLVALFEDDAALIFQPGTVVRGRDER